jgi:hypothetical protein
LHDFCSPHLRKLVVKRVRGRAQKNNWSRVKRLQLLMYGLEKQTAD